MPYNHPYQVIAFQSCTQKVDLNVLTGNDDLIPIHNPWDWLGDGVYFWEENPARALEYAEEISVRKQFNKVPIVNPFIPGAIIELGNCLNLVENQSLKIVKAAYEGLKKVTEEAGDVMPVNRANNKALDCAIFRYIHYSNELEGKAGYDTIQCAFQEGEQSYPGATINDRLHMQIGVINPDAIKGYFLPRPIDKYNPHLK